MQIKYIGIDMMKILLKKKSKYIYDFDSIFGLCSIIVSLGFVFPKPKQVF